MSLLYVVLGAVVIYIAGRPLADLAIARARMVMVNGAPGDTNQEWELVEPIVKNNTATEQSEIRTPSINTQYGTISCEQIALTAPLYYGDNSYSLQNGVGQYTESGMPGEGKPILIGGHDATFFATLKDIEVGDIVLIKTTYGEYKYQVVETKVSEKEDKSAYDLTQTKEQLILYTCYPFGQLIGDRSRRYFVYLDRLDNTTKEVK